MEQSRGQRCHYDPVKRAADVVGAALLLIMTAPIQLVIAILVARHLGRPVLFRQKRPGRHGVPFVMLKFRSMRPVDEARGWLTDAERLTPLGRRLRTLSLDELPTLWNVLCGHMSLVGPRPLLMEYLDRYTPQQARRHEVRPGITGLAQVSGRNALTWEEKFGYDLQYIDHRNLRLDARILLSTVRAVIGRDGITHQGHATMAPFGEQSNEA
ncbi:sugar transferase [Pseudactinotalea sp. Z1748]|uniref:sugar transferase n=1 Tax=Pseudactinotalea sp. Z1748 TaxID=3413027 RepID=UPI003C7B9249